MTSVEINNDHISASTPHVHVSKALRKLTSLNSDSCTDLGTRNSRLGSRFQNGQMSCANRTSVPLEKMAFVDWSTKRAKCLFDMLVRPPLLFHPSLGIYLPFLNYESHGGIIHTLPLNKRSRPIDPDPCLFSIDGLLDCFTVTSLLVDQAYQEALDEMDNDKQCDHNPVIIAANYFKRRSKFIGC